MPGRAQFGHVSFPFRCFSFPAIPSRVTPEITPMATFRKRGMKWQAQVRRQAHFQSAVFETKAAAQKWARRVEGDLDHGRATGVIRSRHTVGDLLGRYEVERRKVKTVRRSLEHILGQLDRGLG